MYYKLAEIIIKMNCQYDIMIRRSKKYLVDETTADFSIAIPEKYYSEPRPEFKKLLPEQIELILMGNIFSKQLLMYNGFVLHASALMYQDKAILFSADSGVGKSTHTQLWRTLYNKETAIINDDKPAVRLIDHQFYVYGTPFSGNSEENMNVKVQLHAIVFIERSDNNWIEQINTDTALPLFMQQTLRPNHDPKYMQAFLITLDELLKQIPCYILHCNTDISAVNVVKEALFNQEK